MRIKSLPNDLLKFIFSFFESSALTAASAACVAFHGPADSVKRTATFGRKLLVVDGVPTLERLGRARERFPALCVDAIDLKGCNEITDDFIVTLVDASIGALAGNCHQLKSVNFCGCELLTDASIRALAENCHQLKSVDLHDCKRLTDASIVAFAGSCPLLKSVNFACCTLITDASIAALKAALPNVSVRGR